MVASQKVLNPSHNIHESSRKPSETITEAFTITNDATNTENLDGNEGTVDDTLRENSTADDSIESEI